MAALDSPEPAGPPGPVVQLDPLAGELDGPAPPPDAPAGELDGPAPPPDAPAGELDGQAPQSASAQVPPAARPHGLGWRPWLGRPRVRDVLCLAGLALSALYALAMIPLTPALIATRPVLLELLSGSTSAIVAAGSFSDIDTRLQLTVVIAAALPGLMRFDLLFWWAGILWGHRIVEMLGQHSKHAAAFAQRAEQRGPRFAAPAVLVSSFLPIPTQLIYAAAGWVGLRFTTFIIFDLIGSAAWASLLAVLGFLLGPAGVAAANAVSHYALATIAGLVAIAIAPQVWHALRSRRRAAAAGPGQDSAGPGQDSAAGPGQDQAGLGRRPDH